MTKEEEKLLLTDLCSRIPYGVRVKFTEFSSLKDKEIIGITAYDNDMPIVTCRTENGIITMPLKYVKPYLYPISSMTKEQKIECFKGTPLEIDKYGDVAVKDDFYGNSQYTDLEIYLEVIYYLIANHFDYRGLIPMGLAIDATNLKIY